MAQLATHNLDVYSPPPDPKTSAYYKYIENHFEKLDGYEMTSCMKPANEPSIYGIQIRGTGF